MLVRCIKPWMNYKAGHVYDRTEPIARELLRKSLCFEPAAPDKPRNKKEKSK